MSTHLDDAVHYAEGVVTGVIPSNRYVRLQCRKFLDDLNTNQHDASFPWFLDAKKAVHPVGYIELLKFIDGAVAGQTIRLSPWQKFILVNAYGWVSKEDPEIRRYTRLLIMVGRKNAKSMLLSAWGLYELMYAPEGSQIVSLATQRDQAKLVWSATERMAKTADKRLVQGFHSTVSTISNRNNWSRFTPLSKESKRLDGLNIRFAIVDEAAAIPDHNLFEVVESSMGAQKSPQTAYITTGQAGAESSYFYGLLDYAKKVLDGIVEDDRIFCLAYAVEDGDEWNDPKVWIKANPNLGVSVSESFLLEEAKQAEEMPGKRANFRTKYLNEFISTSQAWISLGVWERNVAPSHLLKQDVLERSPLYLGMDLGATSDLTAVSGIYRIKGAKEQYYFDATCFIPEAAFMDAPKHVRQIYDIGVDTGKLVVTEGEVSDHEAVKAHVLELADTNDLREVAFDSWSAVRLTSELQEQGLVMVKFDQNIRTMSPASKEAERLIRTGKLIHSGDPFLNWQLSNSEIYVDTNGNIKVRKGNDKALKVDAIVAMIMAVGRAILEEPEDKPKNFGFCFG